ncbi:hypothetical protein Esti_006282 [Eimeria stiedai]
MEQGNPPRHLYWLGVASAWLRRGAQRSADAAVAAAHSSRRSAFRLPDRSSRKPALLQLKVASASSGEAAEQAAAPRQSSASAATSDLPIEENAATKETPQLHFCDDTNEPEDVCNAQWLMLWSYAAYAPDRPTAEEQQLLHAFFEFFPDQCTYGPAANCYAEAVRASPPRVSDRRELLLWLCMVENQCRQRAGMPLKRCRHSELMKRWRSIIQVQLLWYASSLEQNDEGVALAGCLPLRLLHFNTFERSLCERCSTHIIRAAGCRSRERISFANFWLKKNVRQLNQRTLSRDIGCSRNWRSNDNLSCCSLSSAGVQRNGPKASAPNIGPSILNDCERAESRLVGWAKAWKVGFPMTSMANSNERKRSQRELRLQLVASNGMTALVPTQSIEVIEVLGRLALLSPGSKSHAQTQAQTAR